MHFLADENIHSEIVTWLRSRGHDVVYTAESLCGAHDEDLLALARNETRVLITDDKDFGELVFHRQLVTHGIVLIRLTTPSVSQRIERLSQVWADIERQAPQKFIVISDRKVRVRGVFRPA